MTEDFFVLAKLSGGRRRNASLTAAKHGQSGKKTGQMSSFQKVLVLKRSQMFPDVNWRLRGIPSERRRSAGAESARPAGRLRCIYSQRF